MGNIHAEIASGVYSQFGIDWNTETTAPSQYASWEQHWPLIITDRDDPPATTISELGANLASGETAVPDRPHFSEDRFRDPVPETPKDFESDAEVPTVIRGYGLAGWAAIYGNTDHDGIGMHDVTSAEWSNLTAIKAANDEVTQAMQGS